MGRVLQPGVDQVAEHAGGEQQQPGGSGAQVAAQARDENAADHQVAKQVLPVGVQGEGGRQPPPLAGHDLAGVGVAEGRPSSTG